MFVAAFNSEDPGVLQAGQRCECLVLLQRTLLTSNFWAVLGLSPDVVAATLGDIGVEAVMGLDAIVCDTSSNKGDPLISL
jgi:hypothetical protein